jgi:hypothetical protein
MDEPKQVNLEGLPAIFRIAPPELSVRMVHSFLFFADTGVFISPFSKNNNKTSSPRSPRLSSSE